MRKSVLRSITITFLCLVLILNSIPIHSYAAGNPSLSASAFVKQMNTGWNLGNSLDSHYGDPTGGAGLGQETVWGNPRVSKQQIDFVKSQGFDVIRVPITWYTHTYRDENGTIHIHPDWMARVHEVVDYCISNGFFVIINSHHDGKLFHCGVSDSEFNRVKVDAASIWSEVSNSFARYDEHLLFESFNEVDNLDKSWSFGKKAARQMNELNQIFVNTVRSTGGNNSQRLLMVPTLLDQFGEKFQKSFVLPTDTVSGKLIVTVHSYSKTFDQSLDNTFSSIATFSKSVGVPIIIGEWGTTNRFSPAQYRGIHASNFIARANKYGLKCIYWDNGSDFAIIDRNNLTSNTDMVQAIMNPKEYISDSSTSITDFNKYIYMTLNQTTGAMQEDKHWGTILVNMDGDGGYPIPSGKTSIYVGLVANDNMADQRIHFVYFYDANNNLTGCINDSYGFSERVIDIPAGTVKARIGVNNSYSRTSSNEYKEAINKGNFRIMINLY